MVNFGDSFELTVEGRQTGPGENCCAVLVAFPAAHENDPPLEVKVFDSHGSTFRETKA